MKAGPHRGLRAIALYSGICLFLTLGSTLLTPQCASVTDRYDIAVVLGGGMESDQRVRADETGRVHAALRLHENSRVARLHLTGGPPDAIKGTNAALMAGIAREAGLDESALTLEPDSLSTLQNALFSRPDLPPDARLIVVTEGFHGWRARASFAWAGRPTAVCASQPPGRSPVKYLATLARETAAWGINIPRAALWSLGQALGLGDRMPPALIARSSLLPGSPHHL